MRTHIDKCIVVLAITMLFLFIRSVGFVFAPSTIKPDVPARKDSVLKETELVP